MTTKLEQAAYDVAIAYAKACIRLNEASIGHRRANAADRIALIRARQEVAAIVRLFDLATEQAAQDNVTTALVRTNEYDVRNDPPQMDWNGEP